MNQSSAPHSAKLQCGNPLISDRERYADAESQELLELFATITPRLVWIADSAGRYKYETKGWRELTGPNHHFEECIHPDDRVKRQTIRTNAFRNGKPYQLQYRVKTVKGHYRWFLECAQPRRTAQGKFADMIGTCVDVT